MKKENKTKTFQNKNIKSNSDIEEQNDDVILKDEEVDNELDSDEERPFDDSPIEEIQEEDKKEEEQPVAAAETKETKPQAQEPISNKQKIRSLQRQIENKKYSVEREQAKVEDWRKQAKIRDERAKKQYESRKTELESLLKKSEERHKSRMARTKKQWWDYSNDYEVRKIKKLQDDVSLLETELAKLQSLEQETQQEAK